MTNQPHKVLFIEDEQDILLMYKIKFTNSGFNFHGASNGNDGIKLAETEQPELIMLDIWLVNESGLDILKKLKSNDATKNIPVVLFSNAYQKENEQRGLELGAEKFILKTKILPGEMAKIVQDRLDSGHF